MKNNFFLPNLYGIFEVKHFSNKKIRIESNKLKNNLEEIEKLKENLSKIEIIKNYKILPKFGSLSVEFDNSKIDNKIMLGVLLKLLDLEKEIFQKRNGKIKKIFNDIIDSSDVYIYNKTRGLLDTRTSVALIFLLYGIKKLKVTPALPAGATLIWWSYNILTKEMKGNQ